MTSDYNLYRSFVCFHWPDALLYYINVVNVADQDPASDSLFIYMQIKAILLPLK